MCHKTIVRSQPDPKFTQCNEQCPPYVKYNRTGLGLVISKVLIYMKFYVFSPTENL